MSKQSKQRRSKRSQPITVHNRVVWALLAGAGLILAAALLLLRPQPYQVAEDFVPEVEGAPRVALVSDEVIDYGDVPLNTTVETVFRFRNTGDQVLQVLGEPTVELVEGC